MIGLKRLRHVNAYWQGYDRRYPAGRTQAAMNKYLRLALLFGMHNKGA
jgi:hypothetical protein